MTNREKAHLGTLRFHLRQGLSINQAATTMNLPPRYLENLLSLGRDVPETKQVRFRGKA